MHAMFPYSLCALFLVCLTHAYVPEPYTTMETVLPYRMHGWFPHMTEFDQLFTQRPIKTVVEVGAWLGLGTSFMAHRMPEGGKIFSVDIWENDVPEYQYSAPIYASNLYDQFRSNMVRLNLTDIVHPVRDTSVNAAKYITSLPHYRAPDFIFIDADHETKGVMEDLEAWYPHLAPGGLMCGHDIPLETTRIGVMRFAQKHGLRVFLLSMDSWCFEHKGADRNAWVSKGADDKADQAHLFEL